MLFPERHEGYWPPEVLNHSIVKAFSNIVFARSMLWRWKVGTLGMKHAQFQHIPVIGKRIWHFLFFVRMVFFSIFIMEILPPHGSSSFSGVRGRASRVSRSKSRWGERHDCSMSCASSHSAYYLWKLDLEWQKNRGRLRVMWWSIPRSWFTLPWPPAGGNDGEELR